MIGPLATVQAMEIEHWLTLPFLLWSWTSLYFNCCNQLHDICVYGYSIISFKKDNICRQQMSEISQINSRNEASGSYTPSLGSGEARRRRVGDFSLW